MTHKAANPSVNQTLGTETLMAKKIFIHSKNPTSMRLAIFEDNEKVAFLYLTKPDTQTPEKDVVAYSRVPLVASVDWKKIKETGDVPPLTKYVASSLAIIQNPIAAEFSFMWSADGNAVALLRNNRPIAFASTTEKFGYSKAVVRPSALANPWDQQRFEATFKKLP